MWLYSPSLTLVVMSSLPLYAFLSVVIAPATRARLHEKIADNQSFLVKAIGSIQFGFR
jgi:subfamily B ATP-binding cassette protein HlyB/CyaB